MFSIIWNSFIENFVSTFISVFTSVLFAFFVKDFYDVFMQKRIKHNMNKVKNSFDVPNKHSSKIKIRLKGRNIISDAQQLFDESVK